MLYIIRSLLHMCPQGVTAIVRVCEPTYEAAEVEKAGIAMHDMPFDDGTVPPKDVLAKWRGLVKGAEASGGKVAIHCVAGLGRAPVMVAIALIDKVKCYVRMCLFCFCFGRLFLWWKTLRLIL